MSSSLSCDSAKKKVFIVNPNAARGNVAKHWPEIESLCRSRLGDSRPLITSKPGDAREFACREALNGSDLIVCVGGDGTLNEVINGLMSEEGPIRKDAAVGFIPFGTGCDFRRTLSIPKALDKAVEVLAAGRVQPIDLGRLTYLDHEGRSSVRYFHNVTSFGLGGEVDERVKRVGKGLGGFGSFLKATLISLMLYNKKTIRLKVDDVFDETVTTWNIAVANGQYHGGGMWIAPDASPWDGLFHVTVIGDLSLPEVCYHLPKLYTGRLAQVGKVRTLTGKRIEALSEQRVLLDVDGEQPGLLPVKIDMVPAALRFLVPAS